MSNPKERPILFSGPMVRAILQGRKTQTRRIIKPQPPEWIDELHGGELSKRAPYELVNDDLATCGKGFQDDSGNFWKCAYGNPGDRLWVRETFSTWHHGCQWHDCTREGRSKQSCSNLFYRASHHFPDDDQRWVPSIFMPRWASRITLEIVSVRVERLQDISQPDIASEGFDCHPTAKDSTQRLYRSQFSNLWESINGPNSWAANPWVWVVEFSKVTPPTKSTADLLRNLRESSGNAWDDVVDVRAELAELRGTDDDGGDA